MEPIAEAEKICSTVVSILKESNLEQATELSVRTEAAARLGLDLSSLAHKKLVRRVLETYLLSMEEEEIDEREVTEEEGTKGELEFDAGGHGRVICKLSDRRGVSVHGAKGNPLVSIREYYPKRGKLVFSSRGISLTNESWSALRKSIPDIEATIEKMELQIRSEDAAKQSKEDITYLSAPVAPRPPPESIHTEAVSSNTSIPHSLPRGLVPIQTPRLDGKNYHCWVHVVEFFLRQVNISYVLTEPCPVIPLNSETCSEELFHAKAAAQKWRDDDYLCRHSILNSLCDHLFESYSGKAISAKELWEELKLAYDNDIGTMRSQVNKYIQFQMVDGVSVLEQIHEFHKIANSIAAAGVFIDENLHVSAIVSKLPLSWKEFSSKLLQEEFLPLNMLMNRLGEEEMARDRAKREEVLVEARDCAEREEAFTKARDCGKREEAFTKAHDCSKRDEASTKAHVQERRNGNKINRFKPKGRVWKRPG